MTSSDKDLLPWDEIINHNEPEPTSDVIVAANEALKALQLSSKKTRNNNGMFAVIGNDASRILYQDRGACHGDLVCVRVKDNIKPSVVATLKHNINNLNRPNYSSEVHPLSKDIEPFVSEVVEAWYDYITNHSFARKVFLTNTDDGFILDCRVPGQVLAGACMLTRHPREKLRQVVMWYVMTRKFNMNHHLAYLLCLCIGPYSTIIRPQDEKDILNNNFMRFMGATEKENSLYVTCGGHNVFEYLTTDQIKTYVDEKFVALNMNKTTFYSNPDRGYFGVKNLFGSTVDSLARRVTSLDNCGFDAFCRKYVKDYSLEKSKKKEEKTDKPAIVNPFLVKNIAEEPVYRYTPSDLFFDKNGLLSHICKTVGVN